MSEIYKLVACTFCGKLSSCVKILVAAPQDRALICDECIKLCMNIVKEKTESGKG